MSKRKVEQDKEDHKCLWEKGPMTVLNKPVRIDLTEKVTCGQTVCEDLSGVSIPDGVKSWCKKP